MNELLFSEYLKGDKYKRSKRIIQYQINCVSLTNLRFKLYFERKGNAC